MGGIDSDDESDKFSWSSDDELEEKKPTGECATSLTAAKEEASSSSGPSSALFRHFVSSGFSVELVSKAIEENGDGDMDSILNAILTYKHLESSPSDEQIIGNHPATQQNEDFSLREDDLLTQNLKADSDQNFDVDSDDWSSDYNENILEDFSDSDSCPEIEDQPLRLSEEQRKMKYLKDMGYPVEEISIAIERCGSESSIEELADFIGAAQLARALDTSYVDPPVKSSLYGKHKKRKMLQFDLSKKKQKADFEDEPIRLPKPMIGFGVPTELCPQFQRTLPEAALGPPYFYYENVALAPKGVWDTISRFLYDVEPEFVDSKYFCAAARKRGYIHNLPIDNRYPLLPMPPRTINEALPLTKRWWPRWDARTKLNCLQTCIGSAKLTERIRKAIEQYDDDPPPSVQKFVIEQCRKWNLVWVGRNKVAPLEPDEVEMLLGFPRNHTRGGGVSRTERYKSLGNSFQMSNAGESPLKVQTMPASWDKGVV
ncbi:hypothetical protein KSS87_012672 [Heliosperma pusillum]|nr:hypothetical protein KSS87_012672 [Heliosperma pusillum]